MERLDLLARIGAAGDGGGITRPGLSAAEDEAHALLAGWCEEAGLAVSRDAVGNLYARPRRRGRRRDLVRFAPRHGPSGGRFDGALGVVAALEAVADGARAGSRVRPPDSPRRFAAARRSDRSIESPRADRRAGADQGRDKQHQRVMGAAEPPEPLHREPGSPQRRQRMAYRAHGASTRPIASAAPEVMGPTSHLQPNSGRSRARGPGSRVDAATSPLLPRPSRVYRSTITAAPPCAAPRSACRRSRPPGAARRSSGSHRVPRGTGRSCRRGVGRCRRAVELRDGGRREADRLPVSRPEQRDRLNPARRWPPLPGRRAAARRPAGPSCRGIARFTAALSPCRVTPPACRTAVSTRHPQALCRRRVCAPRRQRRRRVNDRSTGSPRACSRARGGAAAPPDRREATHASPSLAPVVVEQAHRNAARGRMRRRRIPPAPVCACRSRKPKLLRGSPDPFAPPARNNSATGA